MRLAAFASLIVAFSATIEANQDGTACNLACAKGETCELKTVQCITAPCDPVPTCVPIKGYPSEPVCTKVCPTNEVCQIDAVSHEQLCFNPCAVTLCIEGTTCVVEQVQCIRAPCPPLAVCKPNKKCDDSYGRALRERIED
ncbi:uncharacterized protein PHALS_14279 [Plasmopara halstedii]|uniref:RxLR-like protein n=1 Tax=Plasmopara halstedii TaxID=4781 RepID=A0A0P1ARS7_PLAHL|nr:uncharacterized protein PHALS_14279 [Plasmopara halstedii]CEG44006.1 hypothetical protein PHALS_14279 [Plasmopara halstedii]|eukprot:XP_024580375.1 hypothetical protein PHALS_14279 [Plasmopara halstedii]